MPATAMRTFGRGKTMWWHGAEKPEVCTVQVLHMGIDIANSGMRYNPGDSIGVVVQVG